ncbi:MAG: PLDc N-terminal domain-containing protein [Culicoidibacterales bacterium]
MVESIANIFHVSSDVAQIILPILIIHSVLVLIVVVDVIKNWQRRIYPLLWIVLAIAITFIGPLIYFIVGRKIDGSKK